MTAITTVRILLPHTAVQSKVAVSSKQSFLCSIPSIKLPKMTVTMLACLLAGGTCIFTLSNTSEQPNTRSFPPFCVESTEQSRPLDWNKNEIPPSCCPYLKQHVWTGSDGKSCTPCILLKAASLHHLHVLHLKILCSWGLAARGGSLQTSTLQNTAESACRMSTALTATTLPPLLPRTQRSQTITKQNHQSMHIERKQPGFTIFTLFLWIQGKKWFRPPPR